MPKISEKIQHIQQQIRSENHAMAIGLLNELNVADQASILKGLKLEEQIRIFQELKEPSRVFEFMPLD